LGGAVRKALTFVAAIAATITVAAGCGSDDSPSSQSAPAPVVPASSPTAATTTEPAASPSASAPATTPTAPATTTPAKPPAPAKLHSGSKGAAVTALQRRLNDLGYWNGKADGTFGGTTQQAVYAVQKVAGLSRDGVVGPKTAAALEKGVRPTAKSKSGHIIEINKAKQILMIVDNGKVGTILNASTGSNQHYTFEGQTHLADTPSGHFTASRQIDGWRHGPLGPLWRPKYFNGGIAVHGAPSVPPYPASHGCSRVSMAAMNWIWSTNKMPLKTKVWVY
jgi:pyruvate/2-oxoglutarate dehydrogenase complex dihydrolipoamide acyltransferase (E2) component